MRSEKIFEDLTCARLEERSRAAASRIVFQFEPVDPSVFYRTDRQCACPLREEAFEARDWTFVHSSRLSSSLWLDLPDAMLFILWIYR
jgi:hypothetical protein